MHNPAQIKIKSPEDAPPKTMARIADVTRLTGLHRNTVERRIRSGELRAIKLRGVWLIPRSAFEALAEGRTT